MTANISCPLVQWGVPREVIGISPKYRGELTTISTRRTIDRHSRVGQGQRARATGSEAGIANTQQREHSNKSSQNWISSTGRR